MRRLPIHLRLGLWPLNGARIVQVGCRRTSVTQTVYLNTPGQQDSQFTLDVNGERVMERKDVFYRDVPLDGNGGEDPMLSGLLEVRDVLGDAVHTGQQTASLGPTKTDTPVLPLQQALEVEPIGFIGIFFRFIFFLPLFSSWLICRTHTQHILRQARSKVRNANRPICVV